jgi:hypothetical protein
LKINSSDTTPIHEEVLDRLLQILSPRCPPSSLLNNTVSKDFVSLVRKALSEHANTINNVLQIFKFIIRNREVFFRYRQPFISPMMSALNRLGFQERTPGAKSFTLDIIEHLMYWEELAFEANVKSGLETESRFTNAVSEMVLQLLFRLYLMFCDAPDKPLFENRCLELVRRAGTFWNDRSCNLSFLHTVLASSARAIETNVPSCVLTILSELVISFSPVTLHSNVESLVDIFKYFLNKNLSCSLGVPCFRQILDRAGKSSELYRQIVSTFASFICQPKPSDCSALILHVSVQIGVMLGSDLPASSLKELFLNFIHLGKMVTSNLGFNSEPLASELSAAIQFMWNFRLQLPNFKVLMLEWVQVLLRCSLSSVVAQSISDVVFEWVQLNSSDPLNLSQKEKIEVSQMLFLLTSNESINSNQILNIFEVLLYSDWSSEDVHMQRFMLKALHFGVLSCRPAFLKYLHEEFPSSLADCVALLCRLYDSQICSIWMPLFCHCVSIRSDLSRIDSTFDLNSLLKALEPTKSHVSSSIVEEIQAVSGKSCLELLCRSYYLAPSMTSVFVLFCLKALYVSLPSNRWLEFLRFVQKIILDPFTCNDANPESRIVAQHFVDALNSLEIDMDSSVCSNVSISSLVYAARNCRSWFSAVQMLERRICESRSPALEHVELLGSLYDELGQPDFHNSLWQKHVSSTDIAQTLARAQFGVWDRAQDELFNILYSSRQGVNPLSDSEDRLLEDEWIRCAKNLNQWKELYDYSTNGDLPLLALECSWKMGEWNTAERILDVKATALPSIDPLHKIRLETKKVFSLPNPSLDAISHLMVLCEDSSAAILAKWRSLPEVISAAHLPCLYSFQQLVEIQESIEVLNNMQKSCMDTVPRVLDLKSFIYTWRERLPNEWEPIPVWNDILSWRSHMFSFTGAMVSLAASNNPSLTNSLTPALAANLHDSVWILLKFAEIARKLSLSSVSLTALANLTSMKLDPCDNYAKIREKSRLCLENPADLAFAVNMISNCDLEPFTDEQKSELLCIEAEALQKLGFGEESHATFSASVSVCEEYYEGWFKWASLCDQVFSLKKDQKEVVWAEYAVSCYLQAVRYNSGFETRFLLSRVFWLMNFDDPSTEMKICKTFESYSDQLPLWIWLMWIPQLVSSLSRLEGPSLQSLLSKLLMVYPQALFYRLRSAFSEHKFQLEKNGLGTLENFFHSMKQTDLNQASSYVKILRELMISFRGCHSNLVLELEFFCDEIQKRLKPSPEEELESAIHALFMRCFRLSSPQVDGIPSSVSETIKKLCLKFRSIADAPADARLDAFLFRYASSFLNDFEESSPNSPKSLSGLLGFLRKWKDQLRTFNCTFSRLSLHLSNLSPILSNYFCQGIEIPGQYWVNDEPRISQNIFIEKICPIAGTMRFSSNSCRKIYFLGSDGKLYGFVAQAASSHVLKNDERNTQLCFVLNRIFMESKETRSRHLSFCNPISVPLSHRFRLVYIPDSFETFEHVYEDGCCEKKMQSDDVLLHYRDLLAAKNALHFDSDWKHDEMKVFLARRIACLQELVDVQYKGIQKIFAERIQAISSSANVFWLLRQEIGKQIGIHGFLTFALKVGDRTLQKILYSRDSGKLLNLDFFPSYNSNLLIENNEIVPFRLSLNLSNFLRPVVLEGSCSPALVASCASVLKHQDIFKNMLYLYIRDDIPSWASLKQQSDVMDMNVPMDADTRAHILENTLRILQRVQSLMPHTISEGDMVSMQSPCRLTCHRRWKPMT